MTTPTTDPSMRSGLLRDVAALVTLTSGGGIVLVLAYLQNPVVALIATVLILAGFVLGYRR